MDAFKLILVSLAGWMNRQQQHVTEYLQEEVRAYGAFNQPGSHAASR
jgi:hypothetical protein